VRRLLVTLAALVLLSGCGLGGDSREEEIERQVREYSREISVLLQADVTAQQRATIEARLRRLPNVTGVTFADGPTNFRKIQQDAPPEAREKLLEIGPDHWPPSFTVTLVDAADVRQIRDSAIRGELEELPGVADVVIRCTTTDECRAQFTSPAPPR
jgi:cell division protein FtsX